MGFDKVRTMVSDRCSTEYAVARVAEESFSSDPDEISRRLALTDEMRLIMMFEESFPTNGYIDCLDFLEPLSNEGWNIDLVPWENSAPWSRQFGSSPISSCP